MRLPVRRRFPMSQNVFQPLRSLAWLVACLSALPSSAQNQSRPRYIVSDQPAGIHRYVPGRWGMLGFSVYNPTEEDVQVLATTYFDGHPDLQYGRRLWLPAGTRRRSWYPVKAPKDIPAERQMAPTRSLLELDANGRRVLVETRTGEMLHAGLLPMAVGLPVTGVVFDTQERDARTTIMAARAGAGLDIRIAALQSKPLPVTAEMLDGLDQLVIGSDRFADDPAGWIAIRRWLHDGGRLWIMLDLVSPSTVRLLLGDAYRCHVVDRVGLNTLQIKGTTSGKKTPDGPALEFEEPVDLVRVLAPDGEVTHTVAGWPAAFWQPAGRGEVLFTTLDARAWTRPRTPQDPKVKGLAASLQAVSTAPLKNVAYRLLSSEQKFQLQPEAFGGMVSSQIGYPVASRATVALVLAGFCLAVLGIGVWLMRRQCLEHLGWISPVLAGIAAAGLALIGTQARQSVPNSVVAAQLVEVTPGVDDVRARGKLTVYHQQPSTALMGAARGGIFWPDMTGLAGNTRRFVCTDLDQWHWENLELPSGARLASFTYQTQATNPIRAVVSFDEQGISGRLQTDTFQDFRDAVLATTAARNMAMDIKPDGSFRTGPDDVLAPGQYLSTAAVDQQQRNQLAIYDQLLAPEKPPFYVQRPTLFTWATPLEMHFNLSTDARQLGQSLLVVPVEVERPPAGTSLVIPSPWLPFDSVQFPGQTGISTAYSNFERKWLGARTSASRVLLRFQIPPELLPVRCTQAELTLKISAPTRPLEVRGRQEDAFVVLETRDSPVGTYTFEIDRADVLVPDDEGGLLIDLRVGEAADTTTDRITHIGWMIDEAQLQVTAETLDELE